MLSDKKKKTHIAVIGAGVATDDEIRIAEEVGAIIARRDAVLICGGLGGVMEAAARGAKNEGGTTIGILPGHDRRAANSCIDISIATGMGHARNVIVVSSADAVIAVGGRAGTLSEIAHALIQGKTVVSLGGWSLDMTRPPSAKFFTARTPAEAVERALAGIE